MGDYMNFLFNPNGRVSRKDIWLKLVLASIIASIIAAMLDAAIGMSEPAPVGNIVSLFFLWPGIAVSIKRFHDRGMSGWWTGAIYLGMVGGFVLFLYPVFPLLMDALSSQGIADDSVFDAAYTGSGLIYALIGALALFGVFLFGFIVNYCLPGERGPNRYGPDPLDPGASHIDVFN